MTGSFGVDLDQLDELVARLRGLVGFVQEHLGEFDRRAGKSLASWTGQTADAYAEAHREWAASARELNAGLDDMRSAAAQAHGAYTEAIEIVVRTLGG